MGLTQARPNDEQSLDCMLTSSLACLALCCSAALRLWSCLYCLSSLACLDWGCSAALRSWLCSHCLACLASGCSAVLHLWYCTHCLSSLACLTSVCSDQPHSLSLWCRHCSLVEHMYKFQKCMYTFISIQLKLSVSGRKQAYTRALCSLAVLVWDSLTLTPNIIYSHHYFYIALNQS